MAHTASFIIMRTDGAARPYLADLVPGKPAVYTANIAEALTYQDPEEARCHLATLAERYAIVTFRLASAQ